MLKYLQNILTAKDNETFSMTKLIAAGSACSMCFEFVYKGSVDFQGFGIGAAAVMGALAAKYFVEEK